MTFKPFLRNALAGMLLMALVSPMAVQAAPCELERNEHGMWISNCSIKDLFGEIIEVELIPTPIWIGLPDLYADDGDYYVNGTVVEVEVRTGNSGPMNARDFDVTAQIDIKYPNGTVYSSATVTGRVPGVASGQRVRTVLGTVTVPDRVSDWDVHTTFYVDSAGMSDGGEIWELDETNNVFDDGICRVYGKDPDVTVGPCQ